MPRRRRSQRPGLRAALRVARSSNVTMEGACEQRKRVPEERCRSDSRDGTTRDPRCRLRLPDLVRDVRQYCCRRGSGDVVRDCRTLRSRVQVRHISSMNRRCAKELVRPALTSNGDVLRADSLHGGQPRRTHVPTPRFRPTFCGAEMRAARPAQRHRRRRERRCCHAHVDSYLKKWSAEKAGHRVRGVNAIANEIEVRLPSSSERTPRSSTSCSWRW